MAGKEVKEGIHNRGEVILFEPNDMSMLKENPGFKKIFKRASCFKLFQKMDGHHIDVSYKFTLNYNGKLSKLGELVIPAAKIDISVPTWLPVESER